MQNHNSKYKNRDIRQRVKEFALLAIKMVEKLPVDMTCRVIGGQLLRSATSIGANIIEAQASSSRKEFAKYLGIALKSANETRFWLELLRDSGKLADNDNVSAIFQETIEISNILGSSMLTLRGKRNI